LVAEIDGVRYVNDTTATAPDAAIAAIETFGARDTLIVLIAGGADKALNYAEMARVFGEKVAAVVLLEGTATDKIAQAVGRAGGKIAGRFDSMRGAVTCAQRIAPPGAVVLLSPGCASFGMFANEFERGDAFRRIVLEMGTEEAG
jgi:UDP-N-acetylmuramoylalanine--D-glutamate ligase